MEIEKEVIEGLKEVLKKYSLCDNCIGRQLRFWQINLENREKGKIVRGWLGIEKERERCELCGNIFKELPSLLETLKKQLKEYEFDSFVVGTIEPAEKKALEEKIWEIVGVKYCESVKFEINRVISLYIQKNLKKKVDFSDWDVKIEFDMKNKKFAIIPKDIYISGYFRKKKIINQSVNKIFELRGKELFKGEGATFYTFGKLEKEVILTAKKPWVLRIKKPKKRKIKLEEFAKKIKKAGLEVEDLEYAKRVAIFDFIGKEIKQTACIYLELDKKADYFIVERLMDMERKIVRQVDEYGKERKEKILKVRVETWGKKVRVFLETSPNFLPYKFATNKTSPGLKRFLGPNYRIKKVEIVKFEIK